MRLGSGDLQSIDLVLVLDEHDLIGRLAHRALDLLMPGVADQDDRVSLRGELLGLDVDLGDQRAGRVDRAQPTLGGADVNARGDAVGREHHRRALGHLGLGFDEDRAAITQFLDDVLVVDDLLADVDRSAVQLERPLDGLDGTVDAGAVAARRRQEDRLRIGDGHVAESRPLSRWR